MIRSIPDIRVTDQATRDALEAMKEIIEVMLGRRGSDPDDHVLTRGDSSTIVKLFEALNTGLSHDTLANVSADDHHSESHTVASHSDTTATGAETETLTDNSIADALHRHSELSASDGSPDRIVYTDSNGVLYADATGLGLDVLNSADIGNHLEVGDNLTVDTDTLFVNATTHRVGIGTAAPLSKLSINGGLHVGGDSDAGDNNLLVDENLTASSADIIHTATEPDDHAVELDVDASGYGDVKALDINYITGAITTGQDEGVILININEIDAAGGDVFGLEILATDGDAGIYGLKAGALVGPIHQDSGTFANPTTGTDNTIGSSVTDTSIGFTQSPDTITDSNNGFGGFVVGELVVVTGATTGANNTTYTITAAAAGALTVTPQPNTVEDDGATITVKGNVPAMLDGSSGTTTAIFEANAEYILIGAAAVFEEIELIITTGASGAGIKPTFWYSTAGSHQFTRFTPVDGTNGLRNTGVVAWDAGDLSLHDINTDTGTYDIKVIRTRSSLTTSPILGYAKVAATTEYVWDKSGNISIAKLTTSGNIELGHASDTTLSRLSAGLVQIEGVTIMMVGDAPTAHNVASHNDTTATGAELETLTNNSIANTLHRHSELVASDGDPDPALSVDADGRVGIGTTSPQKKLVVSNDGEEGIEFDPITYVGGVRMFAYDRSGTPAYIPLRIQASQIELYINNTNMVHIDTNGNVGINEATPGAHLHVTGASIPNVLIEGTTHHSLDLKAPLTFQNNIRFTATEGALRWQCGIDNSPDSTAFIISQLNNPVTPEFIIKTTGAVGIGTATPSSKLHVVGLPAYANNAAAVTGGLTAGAFYRTNGDPDLVCVVH